MSSSELNQYQFQLEQIEEALARDPSNKDLLELRTNLRELISLYSKAVSSTSAGSQQKKQGSTNERKRRHEDESQNHDRGGGGGAKNGRFDPIDDLKEDLRDEGDGEDYEDGDEDEMDEAAMTKMMAARWVVGQTVLAKYAKDGKMYEAVIESVPVPGAPNPQYTVVFKGYTKSEKVDVSGVRDFDPTLVAKPAAAVTGGINQKRRATPKTFAVAFGNGMDRRSRKKQRNLEYHENMKALETAHVAKQSAWQKFASGGAKGGGKKQGASVSLKTVPPLKKQSMFSTPDDPNAKVGVIGSGKGMTKFQDRGKHIFDYRDGEQ